MLTIHISKVQFAILAALLLAVLAGVGTAGGLVIGRVLLAPRMAPSAAPSYQAPSYQAPSYQAPDRSMPRLSLPTRDLLGEQRERERLRCDQAWRQYQIDYTNYQTRPPGSFGVAPMRPAGC
jgi:hypothetical protein